MGFESGGVSATARHVYDEGCVEDRKLSGGLGAVVYDPESGQVHLFCRCRPTNGPSYSRVLETHRVKIELQ